MRFISDQKQIGKIILANSLFGNPNMEEHVFIGILILVKHDILTIRV